MHKRIATIQEHQCVQESGLRFSTDIEDDRNVDNKDGDDDANHQQRMSCEVLVDKSHLEKLQICAFDAYKIVHSDVGHCS